MLSADRLSLPRTLSLQERIQNRDQGRRCFTADRLSLPLSRRSRRKEEKKKKKECERNKKIIAEQNSLLSRNALSQAQLTENNTNTTRANLIELARDLLLSNFIISKIESLENSMCFFVLFAFASFASLSS